jgi:hypothetical protein
MRRYVPTLAATAIVLALAAPWGLAQATKKGSARPAGPSYRTLTAKVAESKKADAMLTLSVTDQEAKAKQASWVVSVGKQTLLLRAGRNGQYATIDFDDLKKGDTVQAVVALEADPGDKAHTAWWLVQYPPGMTPPAR